MRSHHREEQDTARFQTPIPPLFGAACPGQRSKQQDIHLHTSYSHAGTPRPAPKLVKQGVARPARSTNSTSTIIDLTQDDTEINQKSKENSSDTRSNDADTDDEEEEVKSEDLEFDDDNDGEEISDFAMDDAWMNYQRF